MIFERVGQRVFLQLLVTGIVSINQSIYSFILEAQIQHKTTAFQKKKNSRKGRHDTTEKTVKICEKKK